MKRKKKEKKEKKKEKLVIKVCDSFLLIYFNVCVIKEHPTQI